MSDRPKNPTDLQKRTVAAKIADELISRCEFKAAERDEIIDDLVKHGSRSSDGYSLAKDLDKYCGWSPNSDVVEALDNWSYLCSSEIEQAEKEWFSANPIAPPLPLGSRVTFGWQSETGTIDRIYEYGAGKFCIKVDGDPCAETMKIRRIVNFEDVKLLPKTAAIEASK